MECSVENEEGILIQGKGNYCSTLKKGTLKTKTLLKMTILDEQECPQYNQQAEQKQCKSEVEEICIYPNRKIVASMLERIPSNII